MKVLYIANHVNIGGITSYVSMLAREMRAQGQGSFVASGGGELSGELSAQGIPQLKVPLKVKSEAHPGVMASFWMLRGFVKREGIDIVHANTRVAQAVASLLERYAGVPYVSTCHGFFRPSLHRRWMPLWGKKVIAISEQVREHLIRDLRVSPQQVVLIHNGIDASRFLPVASAAKQAAKAALGLRPGPVVGIIARLSGVKGHAYLIEAMRQVRIKHPEAQLLIAGEGPLAEDLARRSAPLGLGQGVFFFSNTRDTRELLAAMDIFAMPSLHEGLGLGLMEAMASEVAAVGSEVGGIPALIRNGDTGVLVPPKDADALAEAISRLLSDPSLRESLARNARGHITANFTQQGMAARTREVYEQCV